MNQSQKVEIAQVSDTLALRDGIWYSDRTEAISYHEDGNSECFEVEEKSFWFAHRNACISEAVKNFSSCDEVLYDVGGGNGYVSRYLQDLEFDCVLIEPGERGCKNAYSRGLQNVVCSTLAEAGIKDGSLDNVGIFDVIEHIENDSSFAELLYKLLRPDGRLFVTVPAYRMLWSYHDVQAGHQRRYTRRSICRLLRKQGFEIEYGTYFFTLLAPANFLLRTMPTLLGFKKRVDTSQVKKREHIDKDSLLVRILKYLWKAEQACVHRKLRLPFGNSILVVAKKPCSDYSG